MTTQKKKKKSAKEKRVLIGSVAVAAAIVAGSTFAWFASKDEVTNRLSASVDYNVSIVEDFQPPKNWVPGQTINKDVAAVNTGSVDAFVRMWLGGAMRVLEETSTTDKINATTLNLSNLKTVTDENKTKLGLNYYSTAADGSFIYYSTLSTDKVDNPKNIAGQAQTPNEETNQVAVFSEVQSMQAAGVLVYAPTNAGYHWELEELTEMNVGTFSDYAIKSLAKGTIVGTNASTANGVTKIAGSSANDQNYYGSIDASTFTPETTGIYIFRRNIGETPAGTANTYEYSGYYFVKGDPNSDNFKEDTYLEFYTNDGANGHSDYVLPLGAVNDNSTAIPTKDQVLPVTINSDKVYMYTASEKLFNTEELAWTYDADAKKFTVIKDGDKPISVEIALASENIGAGSEQWTDITDTNIQSHLRKAYKTTFYYNNDVEEGDTTTKLIDSLKLSQDTELGAYLAFDFDLNVFLDSVQVTLDNADKESYASVQPWAKGDNNVPARGADNGTRSNAIEIEKISWTGVGY